MMKTLSLINRISLILLCFSFGCNTNQPKIRVVKPADFQRLMQNDHYLVDIQTDENFNHRHLEDALHFTSVEDFIDQKYPVKTVLLYGSNTLNFELAKENVLAAGYNDVAILQGGLDAWEANKLPFIKVPRKKKKLSFTLEEYKELVNEQPLTLVDFYADWCGPCKKMDPFLKTLKKTYTPEELNIIKINVDNNADLSAHFSIRGIPLTKLYRDGKPVKDVVGYMPPDTLMAHLTNAGLRVKTISSDK